MKGYVEYITAADAAEMLDIHVANVGWHCRRGSLNCRRFASVWMVDRASVEKLKARPGLKRGPRPKARLVDV